MVETEGIQWSGQNDGRPLRGTVALCAGALVSF